MILILAILLSSKGRDLIQFFTMYFLCFPPRPPMFHETMLNFYRSMLSVQCTMYYTEIFNFFRSSCGAYSYVSYL